jgi:hypothetical protein
LSHDGQYLIAAADSRLGFVSALESSGTQSFSGDDLHPPLDICRVRYEGLGHNQVTGCRRSERGADAGGVREEQKQKGVRWNGKRAKVLSLHALLKSCYKHDCSLESE